MRELISLGASFISVRMKTAVDGGGRKQRQPMKPISQTTNC
jgi:hypothetical protein